MVLGAETGGARDGGRGGCDGSFESGGGGNVFHAAALRADEVVVVAGEVDQASGYVLDLKVLSDIMNGQVIRDVDHRNLNTDVPWLKGRIPTAENLAVTFWERLQPELPEGLLRSVRVWETDKNWAEVGDRV